MQKTVSSLSEQHGGSLAATESSRLVLRRQIMMGSLDSNTPATEGHRMSPHRTCAVSLGLLLAVSHVAANESSFVSPEANSTRRVPPDPISTAPRVPRTSSPPQRNRLPSLELPAPPRDRNITSEERSTIELFKSSSPSVVHITTHRVKRDFFSLNLYKIPRGSGTGFVWDQHGHLVTNFHVIRDVDVAYVAFDEHARKGLRR